MAVKSSHVHGIPPLTESRKWSIDGFLSKFYTRFKTQLGFASAAAFIYIGYANRDFSDLNAERGFGYALGIFALTCMLVLLVYPVRKRLKFLAFLGATRDWFRNHQVLGIIGPIAALYHCNFTLGSLNSRIALYSALVVAGSGIIGRFIYSKIFRGLNSRKASLKEMAAGMRSEFPECAQSMVFLPELVQRVAEFDKQVLSPPKSLLDCFALPFRLIYQTRKEQRRLAAFAKRKIIAESIYSPAIEADRRKIRKVTARYIARHLTQVRRVAEFTAYQRLFALWHKIHLPFFIVLVITVVVHVYAVHSY